MRIFQVLICLAVLMSCKQRGTDSQVLAQGNQTSTCKPAQPVTGTCEVVDVTGYLTTTNERAKQGRMQAGHRLVVRIPGANQDGNAQLSLGSGPKDFDFTIDQALDLYSRKGCLAQISGGTGEEIKDANGQVVDFKPSFTIRTFFDSTNGATQGHAEFVDHSKGQPIQAKARLSCKWS